MNIYETHESEVTFHSILHLSYFSSCTMYWFFASFLSLFSDIDECYSDPCLNNGTCTDLIAGFSCSCSSGYAGSLCGIGEAYTSVAACLRKFPSLCCLILSLLTEINECMSDPCLNNGTCTDLVAGYSCQCEPGFGGAECGSGDDLTCSWNFGKMHLITSFGCHWNLLPKLCYWFHMKS